MAEISTLIFFQKIRIDLESPSPVVVCDKGKFVYMLFISVCKGPLPHLQLQLSKVRQGWTGMDREYTE